MLPPVSGPPPAAHCPCGKGLYDLINEYLNKYTLEDLVQSGDNFDYVI